MTAASRDPAKVKKVCDRTLAIAVKNISGRRRWSKLNEWLN
jgi:hypothetical protein